MRWRIGQSDLAALALISMLLVSCTGKDSQRGESQSGQAGTSAAVEPPENDLLFMSNHDGNAELYLLHGRSGDWINLTNDPSSDNWGEWSPDGSRIAFQSSRSGNLDIWVMNADGSNPVQLTDNPTHDYVPSWSPDGSQIAFASWRMEPSDTVQGIHIYIMNSDGTGQHRLFPDSPNTSTAAMVSPDGHRFAMACKIPDRGADIFILDSTGAALTRLTDDTATNGAPAYSPDGSKIAFYSDNGTTSVLIVANADGSASHTVIPTGKNWYPRWSPDGQWLVYTTAVQGEEGSNLNVMAIRADGSGPPIVLADGPAREAEGRWRPK